MDNISDETLKAAIAACRPFEYLDDLKKRVAEHIGQPGLEKEHDFGYRVYCLNQQLERETTDAPNRFYGIPACDAGAAGQTGRPEG